MRRTFGIIGGVVLVGIGVVLTNKGKALRRQAKEKIRVGRMFKAHGTQLVVRFGRVQVWTRPPDLDAEPEPEQTH